MAGLAIPAGRSLDVFHTAGAAIVRHEGLSRGGWGFSPCKGWYLFEGLGLGAPPTCL